MQHRLHGSILQISRNGGGTLGNGGPGTRLQLRTEVLPALLATQPEGSVLRAWSAGCSTGEEAYSLAIVFREVLKERTPAARYGLQIFATDLDHDAIDKARTAGSEIAPKLMPLTLTIERASNGCVQ